MDDSHTIAQTYFELRRFCRDIAVLLSTTDEELQSRGWSTSSATWCVRAGTYSLTNASAWLPQLFYRSYRHSANQKLCAYVAVYFDLPIGREQVEGQVLLSSGGFFFDNEPPADTAGSNALSDLLTWHFWREDRDDSGRFTWQERPFRWRHGTLPKRLQRAEKNVHKIITAALPIHEIGNTQQLILRVIDPLLRELQMDRTPPTLSTTNAVAESDNLNGPNVNEVQDPMRDSTD